MTTTKHDETRVQNLCRLARLCVTAAGRVPLADEGYRDLVLRVLGGESGPSPIARMLSEVVSLLDATERGAADMIMLACPGLEGFATMLRRDGAETRVSAVYTPGHGEAARAAAEAAIGAAERAA